MKVIVENLGVLRQAEFELGDMTIICGNNNTGKTYATYALYGFLMFWKEGYSIDIDRRNAEELLENGKVQINLDEYIRQANKIIAQACKRYTSNLPAVFASSKDYFEDTSFEIILKNEEMKPKSEFKRTLGTPKKQLFTISKSPGSSNVEVSLLVDKEHIDIPIEIIRSSIGDTLQDILFTYNFPRSFIASTERTGAAIFRKELDFARNRLLEQMSGMDRELNPFELIDKVFSDYALPVRRNVDFTRQLERIIKQESMIVKNYPELLIDFADIIGGEYRVIREKLCYIPKAKKRLRLNMGESSSSVRSLLDIGFYLRNVAKYGDLLIIDEPELNLHPENQRRIARLFVRLVNMGIKVFITTHSDYIIKELNTLIMLKHDKPHLIQICKDEKYEQDELLSADKLRVYIAEKHPVKLGGNRKKTRIQTLVRADVNDELGIEARSFDTTIEDMNRIQEAIMFDGEE